MLCADAGGVEGSEVYLFGGNARGQLGTGDRYECLTPRRVDVGTVVVSGTEGVAKPDPAAYRLAVERAGLPAYDLVFVDDRASNVDAAIACGLHGLVFTDADTLRADLRALGLPV